MTKLRRTRDTSVASWAFGTSYRRIVNRLAARIFLSFPGKLAENRVPIERVERVGSDVAHKFLRSFYLAGVFRRRHATNARQTEAMRAQSQFQSLIQIARAI